MSDPKFVTLRLGKDSVQDIKAIDDKEAGIQDPPYELTVICKQVPRKLAAGTYAIVWLGSDNSKGMQTAWKQGIRAIARISNVELGAKHNDDSRISLSIGYIFKTSIDKLDLIDSYASAYRYFAGLPIVGLNDYSNQTVREIDDGPRSDVGALLAACGKASSSSLDDIFAVYPELQSLIKRAYDKVEDRETCPSEDIREPKNLIFFGAPGTGKSYQLNQLAHRDFVDGCIRRVTFYPDYTYSQFVGSFKPVTRYADPKDDEPSSKEKPYISYEFVPGPFLETYISAVQNPDTNYLLIVEEINRANPAAVFGDVFQLLDRNATGRSEYEVAVPREMESYFHVFLPEYAIAAHIKDPQKLLAEQERLAREEHRLSLPPNMYIWATMNSADQGVFPMDTAFKRRWDFRYMGIDAGEDEPIKAYDGMSIDDFVVTVGGKPLHWNRMRKAINKLMRDAGINEDKLLGPFFLSPASLSDEPLPDADNQTVFSAAFKDKVLLYLYEDAGKMRRPKLFSNEKASYSELCTVFDKDGIAVFSGDLDRTGLFVEGNAGDADASDGE
ncbi:MAG: McrB family protein [Eggerthellaceae bacterium]|jgi:hypothetical protein